MPEGALGAVYIVFSDKNDYREQVLFVFVQALAAYDVPGHLENPFGCEFVELRGTLFCVCLCKVKFDMEEEPLCDGLWGFVWV